MIEQRFIVYTRPDGGVAICAPSLTALRYMTNGGGRWDGYGQKFLDIQIERQARDGVGEKNARAFVHAMQFGGCSDAEAYEIMRDRYCSHLGTGCELRNKGDFPDRWFRNAWRRSHNGGPVGIDIKTARRIQLKRITDEAGRGKAEIKPSLWRSRIHRAETPEQIKAIWPFQGRP